ncbi:glycosyltransferase [Microbacterium telephonicum]|uniref:D-inositol 3-phosphate glycosyltransferase n=1 Tax=Microbacterium telephonicum TaxID=1714841 RepID=A0A498CBH2_9MICO|nr:glycosyltransferase [Microbacterium telephonicum]RLK52567.1 glycosyltransferase involved in cell wall biosynthesis [Microbacterium telephonicum]
MSAPTALRVVVIAPLRFPLRPPHAGGLESAVWAEVDALRRRGHEVTFIAPAGSDFTDAGGPFRLPPVRWPEAADPTDLTWPSSFHDDVVPALERALTALSGSGDRFDVISNHCLHPLPLLRAPHLPVPMVTTLHTPVDPEFVAAHHAAGGCGSRFISVSDHTRREWARAGVPSRLLPNGVDPERWRRGSGGGGLVWFGRIVPEKGPHVAAQIARRLGVPLTIAGRIGDRRYADEMLRPLLGGDVRYAGTLGPRELSALVGGADTVLVTPEWEEPFGLVGPESLMCGTPVVAFGVGGIPEIAAATTGMRVVAPGDVEAMGLAVAENLAAPADGARRDQIRAAAVARFSLTARTERLEALLSGMRAPSTSRATPRETPGVGAWEVSA